MAIVTWKPEIRKEEGPAYLAIADALESDILAGSISAGFRLPPQRALASALGLDFTTVTRAYREARARGLVEARVGQGTYVKSIQKAAEERSATPGLVDMGMNQPPKFDNPALQKRMMGAFDQGQPDAQLDLLMRYQIAGGTERDRQAGATWLSSLLPDLTPDRLILGPGAQGALLAITSQLAAKGDVILTEALTYPGMRALCDHLEISLQPLFMDEQGLVPEAFEEACKHMQPKALYCTPTLQNPTVTSMSVERRQAIAHIAQAYQVPIIEDDAYGVLAERSLPPIARFAPDLTYYIASLAKCLSPALRIAYIAAPDMQAARQIIGTLRATACMASPFTASIATRWIEDGTAAAILKAIRDETAERLAILEAHLPPDLVTFDEQAFHVWLTLPSQWRRGDFIAQLRSEGVSVVGSDAFTHHAPPEAVRLGLGSPETQADLETSLKIIADLLSRQPALGTLIV
ncbi:MAG: PLP-dependent aminotransferase family protein [Cohaesibacter sp.]|jgi:DNA-binding transcriptional MocR family regulator|nr:PLP-dependent aminotransferase family protein [Cohaesibacter sp.]